MTGMTPRGVDAQRQVGVLAAVDLAADDALGVLHRDPALRPLHEDDEGDDRDHEDDQSTSMANEVALPVRTSVDDADDGVRQADHDAGEDDQRDAVADAALGDLLAEPHDEGGAGGEREHGHDREAEAPQRVLHGIGTSGAPPGAVCDFEPEGDAERLDDRQRDRAVARVLVDLAPPHLALPSRASRGTARRPSGAAG